MVDVLEVLVVDDEPKVGQLLERLLASRGCRVRVTHDGLAALEQFRREPVDLVITDVKMPKLSGLELLRQLKHLDPLLNVVVITAYPSLDEAVEAMKCGACDFLTKPFDIAQVQAILYRCRQRTSLTRQLRHAGEGLLKLEELNRRLAELNDLKSQFLASISHEINTPLCLMGEWLYLLSDGTLGPLSFDQQQAIETVAGAYERLRRLLQQLIDLMHGHEIVLRQQSVTAQAMLKQALERVQPKAHVRHIVMAPDIPPEPIPMQVDAERCTAAFEYLLDNAVKFNHESGRVEVELTGIPAAIRLRVSDTGIGIASEEIGKVFQAFYQVDRRLNKAYEGAGIGLTLAKRYVELHGGSITLQSEPSAGTTVTVELPRVLSQTALPYPTATPEAIG